MRTYYSIMYASTNPTAGEKISIGLFLFEYDDNDGKKLKSCRFHYSKEKMKVVKMLLADPAFDLIKGYVDGIKDACISHAIFKPAIHDIIGNIETYEKITNESNNIIQFSKITDIDIESNVDTYASLFGKFVYKL